MATLDTSISSTAAEIRKLSESAFEFMAFKQETELLHLVLYRNRNQHHVSHWWRYFSMLHKHCFRIVKAYERVIHIRMRNSSGKLKSVNKNRNSSSSSSSGKKSRGHADYSEGPAWATSNIVQDEAHYLYTKLIPAARLSFHGILRQGAFVTLGLALLGLAARLYALIEVIALVRIGGKQRKKIAERAHAQEVREKKEIAEAVAAQKLQEKPVAKNNMLLEGDDIGDSISRDAINLDAHVSQSDFDIGESVSRDEISDMVLSVSHESCLKPNENGNTTTNDEKETNNRKIEKKRSNSSLSTNFDRFDMSGVNSITDAPVLKKAKKSSSSKSRDCSATGDKEKKKSKKKSKKNAIDSIFGF